MIRFEVNKIVKDNISPRLRKTFTLLFIRLCIYPLVGIYDRFYRFYDDKRYELIFNGQVIYLEHLLNDQFDDVNRGIYISDAPQQIDQVILFNKNENNEKTIIYNQSEGQPPVIIYNRAETFTWSGFIVNIPTSVNYNEDRLRAYLNKYKLASKNYSLNII